MTYYYYYYYYLLLTTYQVTLLLVEPAGVLLRLELLLPQLGLYQSLLQLLVAKSLSLQLLVAPVTTLQENVLVNIRQN